VFSGKETLFQRLDKLTAGGMFFQMKEDKGVELIVKIHLQRPIASGFEQRGSFQDVV
jgi:hypothetical protein